jgi:hypothetical protein
MQGFSEDLAMRTATTLGLGVIAILAGAVWAGAPETAPAEPRWLSDYATAQEQARREHRPILAVLH